MSQWRLPSRNMKVDDIALVQEDTIVTTRCFTLELKGKLALSLTNLSKHVQTQVHTHMHVHNSVHFTIILMYFHSLAYVLELLWFR